MKTNQHSRIECHFCNRTTRDVEAAIEAGWIPSFYEVGDEHETPDPVCPMCQEVFLEQDDDGEMVYSPERDHRRQYSEQAKRIAAAAPELLAACRDVLEHLSCVAKSGRMQSPQGDCDCCSCEMSRQILAAIAKAEGKPLTPSAAAERGGG